MSQITPAPEVGNFIVVQSYYHSPQVYLCAKRNFAELEREARDRRCWVSIHAIMGGTETFAHPWNGLWLRPQVINPPIDEFDSLLALATQQFLRSSDKEIDAMIAHANDMMDRMKKLRSGPQVERGEFNLVRPDTNGPASLK